MKAQYADKIFKNGNIYINDDRRTYASAIAVSGDKIIKVGDDNHMQDLIGSDTEIIDLAGNTVLPGMIDCHIHPPGNMLYELFDIDLFGSVSCDEVLNRIKLYIDAHPDESMYYGSGFHMSLFAEGLEAGKGPSKKHLDKICPSKPIIIHSEDMHSVWANSKAFEIAGINSETPDPPNGRIEREPDTGNPWGVLREVSAIELLPAQQFSLKQKEQALEAFQRKMHSWGYTGMVSLPGAVDITDTLAFMADKGTLKLRTSAAYYFESESETDLTLEEQFEIADRWRNDWSGYPDVFRIDTIKIAMDGVVEGVTAGLVEPYCGAAHMGSDYHGELQLSDDMLENICYEANKRGYQIHIHTIGDLAVSKSLDAFEKIRKRGLTGDYRNVLTHLQVVQPADFKRFRELNVIAATQPYWMFKEPGLYDKFEEPFLGKERAEREFPLASFVNSNVMVTSSSDHGVTPIPYPFFAIETGITRNMTNAKRLGLEPIADMNDERYLLGADQRLDVYQMVDTFTKIAAYQIFRENEIGTIEEGKFADFIVIDRNIFEIDPLEIENTVIKKTVFGGEIVFEEK